MQQGETPIPVPREFFLNPDFDQSLRGAPSLLDSEDATFVHEMAWHFLFAPSAAAGDSLILFKPLPADFLAYMEAKRLFLPRMVLHPEFSPGSMFTPFGWNAQTGKWAARYDRMTAHPALDIVRKVNSREYSAALEQAWDEESGDGWNGSQPKIFRDWAPCENHLQALPADSEWMAKGIHGHAGTGNLHFRAGHRTDAENIFLQALIRDHGALLLEPWHMRLMDLAVNFTVKEGGGITDFRGHELLNSRDGAFLGLKIFSDRLPPKPWRAELLAMAQRLGQALGAQGYFGPVGVDAYVHATPAGPRLRSLVDINARLSMAAPAHGLAERLPDRCLLWTWTKPRKLAALEDYADLDRKLGADAFDPDARRGILAVSPLRPRPRRISFLLVGRDAEEVEALQTSFRRCLGRA